MRSDDLQNRLLDTIRTGIHFQRSHDSLLGEVQRTVYSDPRWNRITVRERTAIRNLAFFLTLGPDDFSPVMSKTETRLGQPLEAGTVWYANFDAWRAAYPEGDASKLECARFWKGSDNRYY